MPDTPAMLNDAFNFREPTPDMKVEQLTLWATHYYVYSTSAVAKGQPLLNRAGEELGPHLTDRAFCMAAVEGTVRIVSAEAESVTYNYSGQARTPQVDCSPYVPGLPEPIRKGLGKIRWAKAKGPYGNGVNGMILAPFRTIAVDPARIAYQTVIYIPRARGKRLTLPSGKVVSHDGYFFAADTGSAIKENHIDVFGGIVMTNPFPEFIESNSSGTFEAFRINAPDIATELKRLHESP